MLILIRIQQHIFGKDSKLTYRLNDEFDTIFECVFNQKPYLSVSVCQRICNIIIKMQPEKTQLIGHIEKYKQKRQSGIEASFQRFIAHIEGNQAKRADLNAMVGNNNKDIYTITHKEKELVIKFVRNYKIKCIKYTLYDSQSGTDHRIYYYKLRLYKGGSVIDVLELQNFGQQTVDFVTPIQVDSISFQGQNNINSCFHLMNLQIFA